MFACAIIAIDVSKIILDLASLADSNAMSASIMLPRALVSDNFCP